MNEYQIVCNHYPKTDHKRHFYLKKTLAKATQAVIDQNHHAELHPEHFYAREAPWRVQVREVGKWENTE